MTWSETGRRHEISNQRSEISFGAKLEPAKAVALLALTLALTVALLWPMDQLKPVLNVNDKFFHFVGFAALAFPLARTGRFGLLPVFIGASVFGGAIELIQPSFNRSADVSDLVADIVGVILGIGCGLFYRRLRRY